jgi:hypothetical protein
VPRPHRLRWAQQLQHAVPKAGLSDGPKGSFLSALLA